jgi:hypothetical protein
LRIGQAGITTSGNVSVDISAIMIFPRNMERTVRVLDAFGEERLHDWANE